MPRYGPLSEVRWQRHTPNHLIIASGAIPDRSAHPVLIWYVSGPRILGDGAMFHVKHLEPRPPCFT